MSRLRAIRNELGIVDAVLLDVGESAPSWASLPFRNGSFEPQNEVEQHLLDRAMDLPEWFNLDLSDHPPNPQPNPQPNYAGFEASLQGGALVGRALSTQAPTLFSLLLYSLGSNGASSQARLQNFLYALSEVVAALPTPLNEAERRSLCQILVDNGFPALED